MALKLAVPTRCFPGTLKQAIQSVSQLRADGIQLDLRNEANASVFGPSGVREFRKLLEESGLTVGSGAFPLRKSLIDQEYLEERVSALKSAMSFTFELGANVLTVRPGTIPEEDTQWQIFRDVVSDLAAHGNHVGTRLCLSLSFDHLDRIRRLFAEVDSGPLGINFDPVSLHHSRADLGEVYREFHSEIHHIRARDGIRTMDDEVEEAPLGLGEIDWAELVALLHEADYREWVTLDRIAGENRPRDLAHGIKFLRNLMPF